MRQVSGTVYRTRVSARKEARALQLRNHKSLSNPLRSDIAVVAILVLTACFILWF